MILSRALSPQRLAQPPSRRGNIPVSGASKGLISGGPTWPPFFIGRTLPRDLLMKGESISTRFGVEMDSRFCVCHGSLNPWPTLSADR